MDKETERDFLALLNTAQINALLRAQGFVDEGLVHAQFEYLTTPTAESKKPVRAHYVGMHLGDEGYYELGSVYAWFDSEGQLHADYGGNGYDTERLARGTAPARK